MEDSIPATGNSEQKGCEAQAYLMCLKKDGRSLWLAQSTEQNHSREKGRGNRIPDPEGPASYCKDFGFYSKRNWE